MGAPAGRGLVLGFISLGAKIRRNSGATIKIIEKMIIEVLEKVIGSICNKML